MYSKRDCFCAYNQIINAIVEKSRYTTLDTTKNMEEHTLVHNKVHRTVPNILKNSSKLNRTSQISATKTKCYRPNIENTKTDKQLSLTYDKLSEYILPKNTCDKKENRRKQKIKSSLVYISVHGKGLSSWKKKQGKKVFSINDEQERDLSSMYQNVSTDFNFDAQIPSSLYEVESNVQDTIDFSSNEIFSKFNYEYNNDMTLDSCSWHIRDFDDTCNSFNVVDCTDLYRDENDINGNQIDTCETGAYSFLSDDEQAERHGAEKQSLTFSRCLCKDTLPVCGRESDISCDSACDYYCENCVPNWFSTSEVQNSTDINNISFTNTLYESSESNLSSSCSYTPISVTHSALQDVHQMDSPLVEFPSQACKRKFQIQELNEISHVEVKEEHNELHDSTDETDLIGISKMGGEEMEVVYDTKISQIEDSDECSKDINGFSCSLCGLTFSSSRTIAMHQADAHGDLYTIHCETCGRLFNRKYLFNRHVSHCAHSNELFRCDKCPKTYRYKSSLVRHLSVEHDSFYTPRLRTLICGICGKVYKKSRALEKHVMNHDRPW